MGLGRWMPEKVASTWGKGDLWSWREEGDTEEVSKGWNCRSLAPGLDTQHGGPKAGWVCFLFGSVGLPGWKFLKGEPVWPRVGGWLWPRGSELGQASGLEARDSASSQGDDIDSPGLRQHQMSGEPRNKDPLWLWQTPPTHCLKGWQRGSARANPALLGDGRCCRYSWGGWMWGGTSERSSSIGNPSAFMGIQINLLWGTESTG